MRACACACLQPAAIEADRVWEEPLSLDTIGNAYFCRAIHTEPAGLRRLDVVTNTFHLPRVRAIFDVVFALPWQAGAAAAAADAPYALTYIDAGNPTIPADVLAARDAREAASVAQWAQTVKAEAFVSMAGLHRWLYTAHGGYAASRLFTVRREALDPALLASY